MPLRTQALLFDLFVTAFFTVAVVFIKSEVFTVLAFSTLGFFLPISFIRTFIFHHFDE